ncbi:MAG: aldolase catalytic domain-containing protein [Clostridia bacterium]|nr:aldolase catalytic domain-containing protein [Clostridia bacterium]
MKNIELLDCTLRDGGRIVDCKFSDYEVTSVISRLSLAKLNYVEVGFLRDSRKVNYNGGSTFFTSVKQIEKFLEHKKDYTQFVAFIDYGMFDFNTLDECDGKSVDGIRVGFTKKNYLNDWEDVKKCFKIVQEKGYKLFIQGVNSLGYTEEELIDVLSEINIVKPDAFGIVDTYGAMFLNDIDRIYSVVDSHLDENIKIDFHTHNNRQMAFALAQEAIRLSEEGNRRIIIDATLEGMGKCAGNLNLELIADYLIHEKKYDYDFDGILDLIDDFTFAFKKNHTWGYSIPAFMGGIYKSHPNNIIYLTEKFRLGNKDIKNILSMIDEETRQTYKYDNIERKYIEYSAMNVDDSASFSLLRQLFEGQDILVLAPGATLRTHKETILKYKKEKSPVTICVNFITDEFGEAYSFFANKKRYDANLINDPQRIVAVSNVKPKYGEIQISYDRLIDRRYKMFDNSTIMLLNLLKIIGVKSIALAGFDGYRKDTKNNYFDESFFNERHASEFDTINQEVFHLFKDFVSTVGDHCEVLFLTPSIYKEMLYEE